MSTDTKHPVPPVSGYRPLSDEQIALMNEGKAVFNAVGAYLDKLASFHREYGEVPVGQSERTLDYRSIMEARTFAQTASMWAMRAITKPDGFA